MKGVGHVMGNLVKEVGATKIALAAYAQMEAAPRLENHAKANRPWHDISSAAKNGLNAGTFLRGNRIIIYLAHSVDYGPALELAHDCKYAIIDPTVEKLKGEIFEGYTRIMRM